VEKVHRRVVLRFVKPVPAVIGADMKTYGPFLVEDVASLPVENAKILVKQGFAQMVEVS
jgi:DNA replication initiation complex subunit (GINS family)